LYKRDILRAAQRNAKIITVIFATFKCPRNAIHHTRSVTKVLPAEALLILIPSAPLVVLPPADVGVPVVEDARGVSK
jgi:hypothetical protein